MHWKNLFRKPRFLAQTKKLEDQKRFTVFVERFMLYLSILAFGVFIVDWGFNNEHFLDQFIYWFYWTFNVLVMLGFGFRIFFFRQKKLRKRQKFTQYLLLGLSFLVFCGELFAPVWLRSAEGEASKHWIIYLIIIVLFVEELSDRLFVANLFKIHPALIFANSFLLLIFIGSILLMLPNATTGGIRFVDALFTATSAVSVTGLAVLGTGTDFTMTGQIIILILIQLGGLGMLTFTNLFGLLFRGGTSFQNQLFIKDTLNARHLNDAFKNLIKIILFTFIIEAMGALFIFLSLDHGQFATWTDEVFFAVFHAISAFCNAGFSTLGDSLYQDTVRHNYSLHFIIALLILAGGIGYSIMINYYHYLKDYFHFLVKKIILKKEEQKRAYRPLVTINTRIAVWTSVLLVGLGMFGFALFEWQGVLADLSWQGKLSNIFFAAITPRTAGFNTVDMGALASPTIMLYLLLMWIGASPGSTGGGIKTTTFAVASFNLLGQLRGQNRLEVFWREIPVSSVQRAFAIIGLSLMVIGLGTTLLTWFEPKLSFQALAFEVFSAYSTVGLSLGITAELSDASRVILMITMFLGRVGSFTLLLGLVQTLHKPLFNPHQYPKEDVFM